MKTVSISVIAILIAVSGYLFFKAYYDESVLSRFDDQLYPLSLDADIFKGLPDSQNVVLSFQFNPEGKLTLNGWVKNITYGDESDRDFDEDPKFLLETTDGEPIELKPETIFNNLVLRGAEIAKVKELISETESKCVIFTPTYDNDGNNITYDISLTEDCNNVEPAQNFVSRMNPSPPKQYN